MELYLLSAMVLLLAVLLAILVIKLIRMVREGQPLLAIGTFEWRLKSPAGPGGLLSPRPGPAIRAKPAPRLAEPADVPVPRERARRILSASALAQREQVQDAAQDEPDWPGPGPDLVQWIESRLEQVFDRYCAGNAELREFRDLLDSLQQDLCRATSLGTVSAAEAATAEQALAWCRSWVADQEKAESRAA